MANRKGREEAAQMRREDEDPVPPVLPKRDVPQTALDQVLADIEPYLPKVPSDQADLRPENLPDPEEDRWAWTRRCEGPHGGDERQEGEGTRRRVQWLRGGRARGRQKRRRHVVGEPGDPVGVELQDREREGLPGPAPRP